MATMQARKYLMAIFGGIEAMKARKCIGLVGHYGPNGYGAEAFGRVIRTNRRVNGKAGYYPVIFPS